MTALPRPRAALLLTLGMLLSTPAALAQVPGVAEAYDRFGEALAAGDFDGDGRTDLAVGVPHEDVGSVTDAGAVNVLYGTPFGFGDGDAQIWHQNSPGLPDVAEAGDTFGAALAAGDFDGDGYDDLAVGSPGEDLGNLDVGQVHILRGTPSGLTGLDSFALTEAPGAQDGMALGAALAAGDFDGDGYDDLAIGVPLYDIGSASEAGAVYVFSGSGSGITTAGHAVWHQDRPGLEGIPYQGTRFGHALATGDFNGDGYDDLAIGAPRNGPGSSFVPGAVHVLYGEGGPSGGLSAANATFLQQGEDGIKGGHDLLNEEAFGWSLAAGDFDSDGYDDLAAADPGEDLAYPTVEDAGAVNVIYGTASGLTYNGPPYNQLWHQNAQGVLDAAEERDRFGHALAAADFDGDGDDDLAVGVPEKTIDGLSSAGAVAVLRGAPRSGLTATGNQVWSQESPRVRGAEEAYDRFGQALTAADFNGNGTADLAIGVPDENVGSTADAGAVNALFSNTSGLTAYLNQIFYQGYNLRIADPHRDDIVGRESSDAGTVAAAIAGGSTDLLPATPNPFRGRSTLRFSLAETGPARLTVHDALGRTVAVLTDGTYDSGTHAVPFDAADLPTGTYLVRLDAGGTVQTQRLTLIR